MKSITPSALFTATSTLPKNISKTYFISSKLYQQNYPQPIPAIADEIEAIDLDFLQADLPKLLSSMKIGAERIKEIVLSLRNFSRMDEAEYKVVKIHDRKY